MDDLDPEKLWEDKGADYIALYDEVLERVASWLESDLQKVWDGNTFIKHPWFLARNAGLRAWSLYEANLRLRPFYREKYTLADYCEFKLLVGMQKHEAEVKDPSWSDFLSFMTQTEGISFLNRIVEKAKLKPAQHQLVHRLFCCLWDREVVPFEFWTYSAMQVRFAEILTKKGAADTSSVSEGNLRQLVARFKLTKSRHVIVSKFVAGDFERFDGKAAAAAGLPKDVDDFVT
jgi:hypothetical protein